MPLLKLFVICFVGIFSFSFPVFAATELRDDVEGVSEPLDHAKTYAHCLDMAKKNPTLGWEESLAWQGLAGGEAAQHCAAIALIHLGKYSEAATRLETLGNESVQEDTLRAEIFAQAAQAWSMEDGRLSRADSAMRAARSLDPDNQEFLIDHAILLAGIGQYLQVEKLLSLFLERQPARVDALVLRASARRYLNQLDLAWLDIEQAILLDSQFDQALLERGMIQRLRGNDTAARADWMKIIELYPKTQIAEIARRNLDILDTKQ